MAKRKNVKPVAPELPPDDPAWDVRVTFKNIGERDDFFEALNEATEANVNAPLFEYFAQYIQAWPYADLDPKDAECYRQLDFDQWDECQRRVGKALAAFRPKAG